MLTPLCIHFCYFSSVAPLPGRCQTTENDVAWACAGLDLYGIIHCFMWTLTCLRSTLTVWVGAQLSLRGGASLSRPLMLPRVSEGSWLQDSKSARHQTTDRPPAKNGFTSLKWLETKIRKRFGDAWKWYKIWFSVSIRFCGTQPRPFV